MIWDRIEYEDWAIRGMEREGLSPEEYCNRHAYNMEDIIKEPDFDDDDDYDYEPHKTTRRRRRR